MSQLTSRLVTDQFKKGMDGEHFSGRTPELVIIVVSLIAGGLVVWRGYETNASGALLSATAIMTGLTFTMTLRFWERSLDARSNQDAFDHQRLTFLDGMRSLLLWTVLSGVVSTVWLTAMAIAHGSNSAPTWESAVAAVFVVYQLAHVVLALLRLYDLSYLLRP